MAENPKGFFPELNEGVLCQFAGEWANQLEIFNKITLHRFVVPRSPFKYGVVFETIIPQEEDQEYFEWKLKDFESEICFNPQFLDNNFINVYISEPGWHFRREWIFMTKKPDESVPPGCADVNYWVLYQKDQPSTKTNKIEKSKLLPCKEGVKWEDVKITLVSDETVKIDTPDGSGRFPYHTLGMADGRNGRNPTMLWELLKFFAWNHGIIRSSNPKYDPKLPDTAKRLNQHLQGLFGIKESIFKGHYKTMKGYETRIQFSDQTIVVS